MNNDERGGLIGVFIFFVLPMILGLILVIKARSLARASIHVFILCSGAAATVLWQGGAC